MTDLVKLRNKIKAKKPAFVRQEAYKRKRLSRSNWRAPKGQHSKMRRKMGSKRKQPSVGYSSPREVRGLTREGLKPIVVKTLKDLTNLKDEIIFIAKKVGLRKKLQLLEKIKELKLKVGNIKNVEEYIKEAKEGLKERKEERNKTKKQKEEVAKKAKEKKEKKEKKEDKKKESEEDKEKKEKEEKRKILEQK